jgi:hypothetical protein
VSRYQLWEDKDRKILSQIGGRALSGQAAEALADHVENVRDPPNLANTAEVIEAHFKSLVQEFGKQYFGRKAAEDHKDAMENGELTYDSHNHVSAVEQLFRINDQLEYLGSDIKKFSEKEVTRKVIAKTLHPVARLKYIRRGGKELSCIFPGNSPQFFPKYANLAPNLFTRPLTRDLIFA